MDLLQSMAEQYFSNDLNKISGKLEVTLASCPTEGSTLTLYKHNLVQYDIFISNDTTSESELAFFEP